MEWRNSDGKVAFLHNFPIDDFKSNCGGSNFGLFGVYSGYSGNCPADYPCGFYRVGDYNGGGGGGVETFWDKYSVDKGDWGGNSPVDGSPYDSRAGDGAHQRE
jgi:hypothetical protein